MNKYQYKVQGVDYEVEIAEVEGNIAKVNVNGIPFEVELQKPINAFKRPTGNTVKIEQPKQTTQQATTQQSTTQQVVTTQQAATTEVPGNGNQIKAPLPGTITDIKVAIGQQVNIGDTVLVLEAMKMQNNIEAEYSGTVTSISVKTGETVKEGQVMLVIG